MLNLNDREWRPFFLRDICDIESGCDIYDAERVLGNTPYITSSALNNGIKYFVGNNNGTLEANWHFSKQKWIRWIFVLPQIPCSLFK